MDYIKNTFNNREIATFFWLLFFVVWACTYKNVKKSLINILKILFGKKILTLIIMMFAYIFLIIFLFYRMKFWDISLIKDTIYWTFGVGFVMLMNSHKVNQDNDYFLKNIKDNFKLVILIEFVVNFYVFNIIVEFILMPIITLFIILQAYSGDKKEYTIVKKLMDNLLFIMGIVLLGFFIIKIVSDYKVFFTLENLKCILLPPILLLLYLPFIYFIALLFIYENIFVRIDIFNRENTNLYRLYLKRKIFFNFKLNLKRINQFSRACRSLRFDNKDELIYKLKNYQNELV